ncbi:hypothetical protein [Acinetobacter courvalinii]|uniref:DUF4760 domain-containing protein n=1 Tax=Acinetobacter courvalinii TaxID=280147 RepID=A0AA42I432_9GAMM|nr:hypothetical protein [Acinetobacter courvalinii]MDH0562170.1 hypothetical protein [Acinetobacter courvalinii]
MNNLKTYEVLCVFFICILFCLEISILGRALIGFDSDFLSAGVTLFAAFIAWILYNDWRDPYSAQKLDDERSAIRVTAKSFRNSFYEFNSHVLNFPGGIPSNTGSYFAEYMRLEAQMLNYLEDLSENLHFYSTFFLEETEDINTRTHKENLIFYSEQIKIFHEKFHEFDPYTNFVGVFDNINTNVRNRFLMGIVEKLCNDLPKELAVMQNESLKKR